MRYPQRTPKNNQVMPPIDGGVMFSTKAGVKRSKAEILRSAWGSGIVAPLVLRKHQVPLYESIMATPRLKARPILCSRRFGKTMTVLVCIEEAARKHPGSIIRLSFPTMKQGQTVIMPNWRKVLATCPEDLRPVDRSSQDEGGWVWPKYIGPCKCGDPLCVTGPGPSVLFLAGTDDADQRERQRGADANWAFLDEAGSQKELRYMVEDILSPQLDEVNGRLVMVTTPPRSLAHDFMGFWDQGFQSGMLVVKTIYENTYLSADKLQNICEERNPRRSDEGLRDYAQRISNILAAKADVDRARKAGASGTWLREYLAGRVGDSEVQVCPEFDEASHVQLAERPAFVERYVFIDQGHVIDFFAALFAEYDLASGKLRVLAELLRRHAGTTELTDQLKKIERGLWCRGDEKWEDIPTHGARSPRRWADDPRGEQQLCDMRAAPNFYSVGMAAGSPGDEENSRVARYRIAAGQIEIDPACTNLIAQTRDGVFREKLGGKQEFERSKTFGHLDAFAALALGARVVNWRAIALPLGPTAPLPAGVMLPGVRPQKRETNAVRLMKSIFRGAHG